VAGVGSGLRAAVGALTLLVALGPASAIRAQGPTGVSLPASAQGVEFNPTASRVYVAVPSLNQVLALDASTNTTVAAISISGGPSSLAVNATTNRLYVASSTANSVTVIDASANSLLATLAGFAGPAGLAVNAATNRLYVANNAAGTLSVVDGTTNSIVGTIPVGIGPRDVVVNASTNRVYVANAGSAATPGNSVTVIDGSAGVVLATVPVGTRPGVLAANPTSGRVYVANQGSNNVSVLDGGTLSVLATVSVSGSPIGVAVNPTTNHVLVTLAGASEAALIDGATNAVVATLPLAGGGGEAAALPALGRFVVAGQSSPYALSVLPDAGVGSAGAPAGAAALLRPLGPLPVAGTVTFAPAGAGTTISAALQGVTPGGSVSVTVPLDSGSLTLPCPPAGAAGQATCTQTTTSQPNVGSTVVASLGGQAVAQGAIVPGSAASPASLLSGVLLAPAAGSGANGVCNFTASAATGTPALLSAGSPSAAIADCLLQGVAAGQVVTVSLSGGPGNPTLLTCPPAPAAGTVACSQPVAVSPVPGSTATATVSGALIAQGVVTAGAQPLPPPPRATAGALLQPVAPAQVDGVINFSPGPNAVQTAATVALERLASGQQATVNVPMVGAPPAPLLCPAANPNGQAVCSQLLNGAVLAGAAVTVLVGGQPVAQGTVVAGGQPPAAGAPLTSPPAAISAPVPLPLGSSLQPPAPPTSLLIPGAPPAAPLPGVPIIPEADSLALLAVGLAALGGVVLVRRRRTAFAGD